MSLLDAETRRRIRAARLLRGLSQRALAAEAGLAVNTVARLEGGKGVTMDSFLAVCWAMEVSPSFFFDRPRADC